MTDRTIEEIASDAAATAGPDDATSPAVATPAASEPASAPASGSGSAPTSESASASEPASGSASAPGSESASASAEPAWKAELAAEVEAESVTAAAESDGPVTKAATADIEEAMKDVVDPELGINVVDLGLVYGTYVDDDNVATLDMTLTSAACPLTDVIEDQTRQALTTGPGGGLVKDFRINWVWLPPWGPDKITDEGRDQLRALGFNV